MSKFQFAEVLVTNVDRPIPFVSVGCPICGEDKDVVCTGRYADEHEIGHTVKCLRCATIYAEPTMAKDWDGDTGEIY